MGHAVMVASPEQQIFKFGAYQLDALQRRLWGPDDQPIDLTSRAFDTLVYLLKHPGELLDKDTLMRAVWPNVIVEENNLNQAISALRRSLGEDHIATIPGRGYQFVTPVKRLSSIPMPATLAPVPPTDPTLDTLLDSYFGARVQDAGETPPPVTQPEQPATHPRGLRNKTAVLLAGVTAAAVVLLVAVALLWERPAPEPSQPAPTLEMNRPEATTVVVGPPSIAVLPFADMSPNQDQEYFADGLSEELINQLVEITGLRVIGRTSSFSFKGKDTDLRAIGQALGVNHLLEGSVRKSGNELRITAQLINPADGSHLWSNTYDRSLNDIFAIQVDIALNVVDALAANFSLAEQARIEEAPTDSLEAYTLYLEVQGLFGRAALPLSVLLEKINRVVELDPEFVEAWIFKARIHGNMANRQPEQYAKEVSAQEDAVQRAQTLAPDSPEVYVARATLALSRGEWLRIQMEIDRAIALGGSDLLFIPTDALNANAGYIEKTLQMTLEAQKLNPLHVTTSNLVMISYFNLGNIDAAMKEYARAKTLIDEYFISSFTISAIIGLLGNVDVEQARQLVRDDASDDALYRAVLIDSPTPEQALTELRRFYAGDGDAQSQSWISVAALAAFLGDRQLAMTAIKKSAGFPLSLASIWQPVFREVRQLDEFKDYMREIGLVAYWREYGWPDLCQPVGADDFECK